jgi:hypothetical protein
MQLQNTSSKNMFSILIVVLVLAFAIYFFFFRNTIDDAITLDEFGNPVAAQVVGQDLIDTLAELQSVQLDSSIFSNPAFLALKDFGIVLADEPKGRTNPFQDISGPTPSRR